MSANRWSAVIVAAGRSSRMGRLKPLLPFRGHTVIQQVARVAEVAGLTPVVVVLGHRGDEIAAVLPQSVETVHNPQHARGGMISSVCAGLAALPSDAAMAVVMLGDQPAVRPETVRALREAWEEDGRPPARCYVPTCDGRRGHPVAVTRELFASVAHWSGPEGLRGMLREHHDLVRETAVDDRGILFDLDTPDDYRRALASGG